MKRFLNVLLISLILGAMVLVGCKKNNPPDKPLIPSGPSTGSVNVSYNFLSSASDPEGDSVAIRFAWGNGDTSNWSNFVSSGTTISFSHVWSNPGTYPIRAQAKDIKNALSDWSDSLVVVITANQVPNKPVRPIGPTSAPRESSLTFSTTATDPDNDSVAIRFAWGDGDTSEWSTYVPSGDTVAKSHIWSDAGVYQIRAQAKDKKGAISEWSEALEVTIIGNRAPYTPATPTGPTSGRKDSSYTFSTVVTDPDGDAVAYRFAWGNGDTSHWSNWVPSGTPVTLNYAYHRSGTYSIRAQAKDVYEALSPWSNPLQITISNIAPNNPSTPSGPVTGLPNISYNFSSSAIDLDGDSVAIRFDWGDGSTSNWSSYVASGETITMSHSWPDTGIYYIKAQAKDKEGATSGWSSALQIHITIAGQLKWSYQTGGYIANSPAIGSDGTIYFGSSDHYLYALNPNGTLKWRFQAGGVIGWSSPSIAPDGTIYVGCNDNYLYAINSNGTLKWRFQAQHFVYSCPGIATDGTIYFGGPDNYLYAVYPNGTLRWRYYTYDDISTSPAIAADGTIYIGSIDDCLYALYPNGSLRWYYETGHYANFSPSIDADGTVYFGSCDYYFYALNPNGTLKWRYRTGSYVQCGSASIGPDGTIYFGSEDYYFYALNPNGTLKWRYRTDGRIRTAPAIASDGTIYFVSDDGYLYALDTNGNLKWRYQIGTPGDEQYSHPTIAPDGTVYVGSMDGKLYAIYGSAPLANTPWPKFHHDLKNTGRVGGGK